jgi:hypothetical protein
MLRSAILNFVQLPFCLRASLEEKRLSSSSHLKSQPRRKLQEGKRKSLSILRASPLPRSGQAIKPDEASLSPGTTPTPRVPERHTTSAAVDDNNTNKNAVFSLPPQPRRGRPRNADKKNTPTKNTKTPTAKPPPATETIYKLERRGEGWGEAILPTLTVEQRVIKRKPKHSLKSKSKEKGSTHSSLSAAALASSDDDDNSDTDIDANNNGKFSPELEQFLVQVGVAPELIATTIEKATAWRFTPKGTALIDRRRASRVERNASVVAEHLETFGILPGPDGIGAVLTKIPEIMLCKPTTNDRWDRRAVELAAFQHRFGHCNVPEDWEPSPELGLWVKRQRIARAGGGLTPDRLAVLQRMNFDFGQTAQITEEWEFRFDQLIDWLLWHQENDQIFNWMALDWGERGGATARELSIWLALQAEYRRRKLLPKEAEKRFEALGVEWLDTPVPGYNPDDVEWMVWLGRLLYVVERKVYELANIQLTQGPLQGRTEGGGGGVGGNKGIGGSSEERDNSCSMDEDDEEEEEYEYDGYESNTNSSGGDNNNNNNSPGGRKAAIVARVAAELPARREALSKCDLRQVPGVRYWLARQRRQWRMQMANNNTNNSSSNKREKVLLLGLAGFDLDGYSPLEWQMMAHSAAKYLNGAEISMMHAPSLPLPPHVTTTTGGTGNDGPCGTTSKNTGDGTTAGGNNNNMPTLNNTISNNVGKLGNTRLKVKRWVETQQALFSEGRLSQAQLRYLTFLGLTWVLSDEVTHMTDESWMKRYADLSSPSVMKKMNVELSEWLSHQRGLWGLGMLEKERIVALREMGISEDHPRSVEDRVWDKMLGGLLAFRAQYGHLDVVEKGSGGGGGEWRELAEWMEEVGTALRHGRLSKVQVLQLKAVGVNA